MRQSTPITNECTASKKLRFLELNAELRDLKAQEFLIDYKKLKGEIEAREWESVREGIKARFEMILEERNDIYK